MTAQIERIGDAVLYLADCMDVLPTLGRVDAVVTDPPYGVGQNAHRARSNTKTKKQATRFTMTKATNFGSFEWDNNPATPKQIELMLNVGREVVIFGGNYFSLPPEPCWLIWDKIDYNSDFASAELAYTSFNKVVKTFRHSRNTKESRIHPTQKPIKLYKWLLKNYAKEGDKILDTHFGSLSIGVAC